MDDDLKATLQPLLAHPSSSPPPIEEIASRARRRRARRRGLTAALALTVCGSVWGVAGLAGSDPGVVVSPDPAAEQQDPPPETTPSTATTTTSVPDRTTTTVTTAMPAAPPEAPADPPADPPAGEEGPTEVADPPPTTATPPAPQPVTSTIQDTQRGTGPGTIQYSADWHPCTTTCAAAPDGIYMWTSTPGQSATIRFTGTRITLFGVKEPWANIATVSVDGGPATDVDYWANPASSLAQAVFRSPELAQGDHSLVITITSRHNPSSAGGDAITIDRAEVVGQG